MSKGFQRPAVELTEELAKAVEQAAENFSKPAKEKMNLREFMVRILPAIRKLREEKGANWSEIAEFLGEKIGHTYSENRIRVVYLSITDTNKKPRKAAINKKENQGLKGSGKTKNPSKKTTNKPPEVTEEAVNSIPPVSPVPETSKPKRQYRPPPPDAIKKDPFN